MIRNVVGVAVALVVLGVFYNLALNQIDPSMYFDPVEGAAAVKEVPIFRIVGAAVSMMVGIVFGALYDVLGKQDFIKSFRGELRQLLRSTRFLRAMLVAPIVFVGVYLAARTEPDPVVSLIFAFQNGFFCDAVTKAKEKPPAS